MKRAVDEVLVDVLILVLLGTFISAMIFIWGGK